MTIYHTKRVGINVLKSELANHKKYSPVSLSTLINRLLETHFDTLTEEQKAEAENDRENQTQ